MSVLIAGLVLALVMLLCFRLFGDWRAAREERRLRMLEESWAVYRAARQIHDQTAAALQAMLDEARASKSERQ